MISLQDLVPSSNRNASQALLGAPIPPDQPTAPGGYQLPGLDQLMANVQLEGLQSPAGLSTAGVGLQTPQMPGLSSLLSPYRNAMAPLPGMGAQGPTGPLPGGGPTPLGGASFGGGGTGLPGAIGGSATTNAPGASGGYTQSGPLMNGQAGNAQDYGLDPSTLQTIGGVTMVRPAIEQLAAIQHRLGVPVLAAVSGEGFRTYAQQQAAYQAYQNGTGNLAAPPGQSMHEAGRAVDIDTSFLYAHPEVRAALDHAGWVNAVSGEPWHWEYQGPVNVAQPRRQPQAPARRSPAPSASPSSSSGRPAPRRRPTPAPETSARRRRTTSAPA